VAGRRLALAGVLAAAALAAPGAPAAEARAKPQRIMSLNMCTDILVLQLVPKSRIASVTYLARTAVEAIDPTLDDGVTVNQGAAEEVLAQKPDLLITGDMSTPMTRRLAKLAGVPLVEVKSAQTFADIRAVTRQVGAAVGEPARAEALIARMDAELADLAAHPPPRRIRVAAWSGDTVPGKATLANAIIEAAGGVNIAANLDPARANSFGIEDLLAARPEVLMYGQGAAGRPSVLSGQTGHAAVRKLWAGRRIGYPEALYTCGAPQSARAAIDLRHALSAVAAGRAP
jgi:iron complex transport system substrate-binding protein